MAGDTPGCPAAAAWDLTLLDTTVHTTLPSVAKPIAMPTCWPVLSRLAATPASCGPTPAVPVIVIGTKISPKPIEVSAIGPNTPPKEVECSLICTYHKVPPTDTTPPASIRIRGPVRATMWDTTSDTN